MKVKKMYRFKTFLNAFILMFLLPLFTFATHNRAGEITYEHVEGTMFTYKITIHTYTKESSTAADRDSLDIDWGDNTRDTLPRTNGNGHGVSLGNDIKYNEYTGTHTYSGLGQYVMGVTDPNRIAGIINISNGNSVNEPFYIEDTINILDPGFYGFDSSPILLNPPIDFANVHYPFIHNPNAYDPDGDSLSFRFITPRKGPTTPVANYVDPNQIPGTPPNNTFTINTATGEVDWFDPYFTGIYNFAILISEYRSGVLIGTIVRDMEVIVDTLNNRPPDVASVHDTCVVAGTQLVLNVSATDPDFNQTVTLSSNGGPYEVPTSPATFTSTPGIQNVSGTFTWNTNCDHIRGPFYQVIFKAQDSYSTPLVDLENWLVTVVAPPPQDVIAVPAGNDINVSWQNPYSCATGQRFIGFSVWRREGSNPFAIDTCDVGLDGQGYVKLAEHLLNYSYLDQTTQIGKQYCYRVLAEFADQALSQNVLIYYNNVYSLPSNEACAVLPKSIPVITNVSVTGTDAANGSMYVAWSKPNGTDLDTVQNPPPYKYVIWRSVGLSGGSMQRIDSITAGSFVALVDTSYSDALLNTADNPYSYKIGFYANGNFLGETDVASSVYLSAVGSDHIVTLSWNEEVPWSNMSYVVYRKNSGGTFDSIGVSNTQQYVDGNLPNLVQQCYRIQSVGSYSAPGIVNPILNLSQDICVVPVDSIAPCAPTLEVHNICNTPDFSMPGFVNQLIWTFPDNTCHSDVAFYLIYYSSNVAAGLNVVDTMRDVVSNSFTHQLANTVAGCYAVTAVDSNGNESDFSNKICVENCPVYELPNVFTPNNDGHNDTYHPFLPIRFVDKVDMKIFDQWGQLVFATTDPLIGWDGKDQHSGKELPAAVYYYVCDVYSGGVKVGATLNGYIHLFR